MRDMYLRYVSPVSPLSPISIEADDKNGYSRKSMETAMKRIVGIVALLSVLVPAQAPAAVAKAPQSKNAPAKAVLPERYTRWLEEEVVYLITKRERDVFLQLQTDRERDIFIDAFWKHRDPTPGTPRNEFKEEHVRRVAYANKYYGRSTPLPGWKTDRGRIYILLGPPKNIEQYDHVNGVYPTEIWFYLGDPDLGLPTAFNVIFFRKDGGGDYILYSPTEHGPRSLTATSAARRPR
jgi:GWxTD domain-containing protein